MKLSFIVEKVEISPCSSIYAIFFLIPEIKIILVLSLKLTWIFWFDNKKNDMPLLYLHLYFNIIIFSSSSFIFSLFSLFSFCFFILKLNPSIIRIKNLIFFSIWLCLFFIGKSILSFEYFYYLIDNQFHNTQINYH